jgi:hypothetical protein
MRYRPLLGALLIGALMVPLTSCTDDPSLSQIVISPVAFSTTLVLLPNGDIAPSSEQATLQYQAIGYYTHPFHQPITKDITSQVTWFSPTPWMVSVSNTGVATATGGGTGFTQISASMKGFHGVVVSNQSTFTVGLPSSAVTTDIVSLTIAPTNPTVTGTGQTESFDATGTTGSGANQDVTSTAVWTSSNTSVATIGAKTGLATTVGAGSTFIVATYTNADGLKVTANTLLTVQ